MDFSFDMGLVRGILTVALMAAFIGLCVWAWSRRRKDDFDAAARLPLEDDPAPNPQKLGDPRS